MRSPKHQVATGPGPVSAVGDSSQACDCKHCQTQGAGEEGLCELATQELTWRPECRTPRCRLRSVPSPEHQVAMGPRLSPSTENLLAVLLRT